MMKLRHPNVVKLVGVCWDEGLLACCLEFVENGTLEDWLRKTTWKKSKKKKGDTAVRGSVEEQQHEATLAEVMFKGYNNTGRWDEALITEREHEEHEKNLALVEKYVRLVEGDEEDEEEDDETSERGSDRVSGASVVSRKFGVTLKTVNFSVPDVKKLIEGVGKKKEKKLKHGWKRTVNPDGSPLPFDFRSYCRYNKKEECGEAIAIGEVRASPKQVFAWHLTELRKSKMDIETVEPGYQSKVLYKYVVGDMGGVVSDRDLLWKTSVMMYKDGSLADIGYSVEDERKPVSKKVRRMVINGGGLFARVKEGSNGQHSVVYRCSRIDPKFGLSKMNDWAAKKGIVTTANPLIELKKDVERLLLLYQPQLKTMSWKDKLLGMSLDCALGVQYLHHERYYDEEKKMWVSPCAHSHTRTPIACADGQNLESDVHCASPLFTRVLS